MVLGGRAGSDKWSHGEGGDLMSGPKGEGDLLSIRWGRGGFSGPLGVWAI